MQHVFRYNKVDCSIVINFWRGVYMTTFIKQIEEDITEYKKNYGYIANIQKDEWALNFWILDKLFMVDDELIESKIVDYNDLGVDAYEIYEDTKEIYLIQNKYYHDNTSLSANYVKNDFLLRAINALENGTYTRSEELQGAYNRLKSSEEFTVYLQLYVTNNNRVAAADNYVKEFNNKNPKYIANIYYLDDISEKYYGEIIENKTTLSVKIESVNRGTVLNINTDEYKLQNVLDARYVMTPVASIYRVYKESIEKGYPIFEKNIREFLGNKGINKKIYETLLDVEERKNFFYYNNGITIICDSMTPIRTQNSRYNMNACFTIENPQIVNGCQTVNSIYEALKNINPETFERDYKDTFVMLKILVIDRNSDVEKLLYKNIVRFNNSQNAIDEKTFAANIAIFNRLQNEFEARGLLLLIKQSDKNKYTNKYKNNSKFKEIIKTRFEKFGIEYKRISDLFVPLEKLLQVINAFINGGQVAYIKKSNMLKQGSKEYNTAIDFIKNPKVTIETLIDLYLLYKIADITKQDSEDKRTPIPYYLVDMFAKYECENRKESLIPNKLNDKQNIIYIVKLYKAVSKAYIISYAKKYDMDYNRMIKQTIDYEIIDLYRNSLKDTIIH